MFVKYFKILLFVGQSVCGQSFIGQSVCDKIIYMEKRM